MIFKPKPRALLSCCVGITLLSIWQTAAHAQTARPPLTVQIQSFAGVERVVVSTSNNKPVPNDLKLQVVARTSSYREAEVLVSRDLVIAAGTSTATAELPIVLADSRWYSLWIHVEQDNNGIYGPRDLMRTQSSLNNFQFQNALNRQLFVSSNLSSIPGRSFSCSKAGQKNSGTQGLGVTDPGSLPAFAALAPFYESQSVISPGTVTSDVSFLQNASDIFKSIHPNDFFEHWTSLSQFQTILISCNDLRKLSGMNAKRMALKRWITAGGQLVVFDCGAKYAKRDDVVSLIFGKSDNRNIGWQKPESVSEKTLSFAGSRRKGVYIPEINNGAGAPKFTLATEYEREPFIKTELMNGGIFVVDGDMTDWQEKDWQLLHNSIYHSTGSVVQTLGVNSLAGSYQQDFRIPGIGDPPVIAFQILIGLFILLIGPGFYFIFNATGRLYLLLVSTPMFSLAAVILLFGYGILSDGFELQGRVLSVTGIDHSLDTAYTHARHVFYSGLAPRDCVFDDQTIAVDSRAEFSSMTRFRHHDGQQSVSGGQIKARSPFQLTSLRCFETDNMLTFARDASDEAVGIVTNSFADRVKLAFIRTKDGWFIAEGIEPDSSGSARKVAFDEARYTVSSLLRLPAPAVNLGRTYANWNNSYMGTNTVWYADEYAGSWGLSSNFISQWSENRIYESMVPVNSYIAILDNNELVANPQPNAIYGDNQLHVIVGKW